MVWWLCVPFPNQVVFFRADRAGRLQSYMLANLQFHPIMASRLQSYMLANLQFHPIMDYDY